MRVASKSEMFKLTELFSNLKKVQPGSLDEKVIRQAIDARVISYTPGFTVEQAELAGLVIIDNLFEMNLPTKMNLTDEQAEQIGLEVVKLFNIKQTKAEKAAGRYETSWGPKTLKGLGLVINRLVENAVKETDPVFTCPECGAVVDKYPDSAQHCNNCGHDWSIEE